MEECNVFMCLSQWVLRISFKLLDFKFQGFNSFLEMFIEPQNFEVFQEVLTYHKSVSQLC